ncbi:MAG: hypothetical protein V4604_12145 [Bacteroidota bacterium]
MLEAIRPNDNNLKMDQENLDRKIRMLKIQNELRAKARISECFHYNKDECKGKIKKAHSIQRNGRLSLIEEEVDGNAMLYSFTEFDSIGDQLTLKPIGKGNASTFMGFCDFHDSTLFSPIENDPYEETEKHWFLHSYRAFAMMQHRKTEQIKAFESDAEFNVIMGDTILRSLEGTYIGYQEGEVVREKFNEILKNQNYEALDYLVIRYPDFHPIAASASMTPKYSPKSNKKLNYHYEPEIPYEHVFFNLIPDRAGSILILSCFPDCSKSILYLDEFEELPELTQKKVLSSILIGYVENVFISPFIYNKLTDIEKQILIHELADTTIYSKVYQTGHFRSKLNLFDRKFVK